jgi:siroheme synthase (precorrin-2 oxidase/ferrochelatase)
MAVKSKPITTIFNLELHPEIKRKVRSEKPTPRVTKSDLEFHGDEVIVTTADTGQITVQVRIMTSTESCRQLKMQFDTQTQLERMFPTILRIMKPKRD